MLRVNRRCVMFVVALLFISTVVAGSFIIIGFPEKELRAEYSSPVVVSQEVEAVPWWFAKEVLASIRSRHNLISDYGIVDGYEIRVISFEAE